MCLGTIPAVPCIDITHSSSPSGNFLRRCRTIGVGVLHEYAQVIRGSRLLFLSSSKELALTAGEIREDDRRHAIHDGTSHAVVVAECSVGSNNQLVVLSNAERLQQLSTTTDALVQSGETRGLLVV